MVEFELIQAICTSLFIDTVLIISNFIGCRDKSQVCIWLMLVMLIGDLISIKNQNMHLSLRQES